PERLGDAGGDRAWKHARELHGDESQHEERPAHSDHPPIHSGPVGGAWADAEWVACIDGKSRPAQPGAFPLAHGVPNRVGKLRGYGIAINPQTAATFIRAVGEVMVLR